jgi:hypothetical protein
MSHWQLEKETIGMRREGDCRQKRRDEMAQPRLPQPISGQNQRNPARAMYDPSVTNRLTTQILLRADILASPKFGLNEDKGLQVRRPEGTGDDLVMALTLCSTA